MNDIQKQQFQRELDAYAVENNLPPITVEQWDEMARQQLAIAVERGIIEIIGFDAVGEPIYQGVQR